MKAIFIKNRNSTEKFSHSGDEDVSEHKSEAMKPNNNDQIYQDYLQKFQEQTEMNLSNVSIDQIKFLMQEQLTKNMKLLSKIKKLNEIERKNKIAKAKKNFIHEIQQAANQSSLQCSQIRSYKGNKRARAYAFYSRNTSSPPDSALNVNGHSSPNACLQSLTSKIVGPMLASKYKIPKKTFQNVQKTQYKSRLNKGEMYITQLMLRDQQIPQIENFERIKKTKAEVLEEGKFKFFENLTKKALEACKINKSVEMRTDNPQRVQNNLTLDTISRSHNSKENILRQSKNSCALSGKKEKQSTSPLSINKDFHHYEFQIGKKTPNFNKLQKIALSNHLKSTRLRRLTKKQKSCGRGNTKTQNSLLDYQRLSKRAHQVRRVGNPTATAIDDNGRNLFPSL
ncbi:unnamed protein product [Moneuplotes crassus]|uniref:Uncharacterized protein n=1 Tax=Euplotes crassus TaxID=5936 RepID=A0AAD1XCH2_EUPCR|nr:unnamed protein product [Moneuplotes crassus]